MSYGGRNYYGIKIAHALHKAYINNNNLYFWEMAGDWLWVSDKTVIGVITTTIYLLNYWQGWILIRHGRS